MTESDESDRAADIDGGPFGVALIAVIGSAVLARGYLWGLVSWMWDTATGWTSGDGPGLGGLLLCGLILVGYAIAFMGITVALGKLFTAFSRGFKQSASEGP